MNILNPGKRKRERERETKGGDTLSRKAFAGCPVVEINKSQINERSKTNGGALCTKERGRGRVYLFHRAHTANVTALEHDRVIKEMNSGYSGPPFHTLPLPLHPLPLFDRRAEQPHLLRFASILGCPRIETDLCNPVSILLIVDTISRGASFQ